MCADMKRILCVTLSLLLWAVPAVAQDPISGPADDDLRALRFYVGQGNEAAAQAELRRLQREFPSWAPPDRLEEIESGQTARTDEIYDLIAQGAYAAARGLIAETQAERPDWVPPPDMMRLLEVSEAQQSFDDAVAQDRPREAIAIARGAPALLTCQRIDNAWRLAELQAEVGETVSAIAVYKGVLASCSGSDIVIATLEKANAITTAQQLGDLAGFAIAQSPDLTGAVQRLEDRLHGRLA